jgi:putative oxidoreductase
VSGHRICDYKNLWDFGGVLYLGRESALQAGSPAGVLHFDFLIRKQAMSSQLQGILGLIGRIALCAIFLLAAAGDIPNYNGTVKLMNDHGVPYPEYLLGGAIAFLILGSLSVILGLWARLGALLLLVFLIMASVFFHNFWDMSTRKEWQDQMIHFMKNLSMAGAMLFIMGNGAGAWSMDARRATRPPV